MPILQAFCGILWILLWALSASFLLSQVPEDYTPKDLRTHVIKSPIMIGMPVEAQPVARRRTRPMMKHSGRQPGRYKVKLAKPSLQ